MTDKKYKALSIKEFSKAAKVYETNDAGVYRMCRKDYPDVLSVMRTGTVFLNHESVSPK